MSKSITEPFLQKKISLYWLFLITVLFAGIGYFAVKLRPKKVEVIAPQTDCPTYMQQIRLNGFKFTHPLLLTDLETEDASLQPLKAKIENYLNIKKQEKALQSASVYVRKLNYGGWFAINPAETYTPASLQKLTIMMSYLKDVERSHALLDKKFYFDKHFGNLPSQNIKVFSLKEHQYYSVKDLLHAMIAYSDNDALNVLYQNMNNTTYANLFADIQLPVPNLEEDTYTMTVKDYAKFLRILYSSTYYFQPGLSEYGLELLTQCTYKEGITKNLDTSIAVAHKFGERTFSDSKQLHEFGIIYYNAQPYLLGIMTKGYDYKQLGEILTRISDMVFPEMKTKGNS